VECPDLDNDAVCIKMIQVSGPTTPDEALAWAKECMRAGLYYLDSHCEKRMAKRRITILDIKRAVETSTNCLPYPSWQPLNEGGTSWRLNGTDTTGEETKLGFEAFRNHLGKRVLLVTVM
jgi:hypothetical protein